MGKCQGSASWALGVLLLLGACANTADVPPAVVQAPPASAPEVVAAAPVEPARTDALAGGNGAALPALDPAAGPQLAASPDAGRVERSAGRRR